MQPDGVAGASAAPTPETTPVCVVLSLLTHSGMVLLRVPMVIKHGVFVEPPAMTRTVTTRLPQALPVGGIQLDILPPRVKCKRCERELSVEDIERHELGCKPLVVFGK